MSFRNQFEKVWGKFQRNFRLVWSVFIFAFLLFSRGTPVYAQESIGVTTNKANEDFPQSITFILKATSPVPIDHIQLMYGTNQSSCLDSSAYQQIDFERGSDIYVTWTWNLAYSGNIPPGSEVWWVWILTDEQGSQISTEKQTLQVEDPGYRWSHLAQAPINLYWTEGTTSFGQSLLQIANQSLIKISRNFNVMDPGKIRIQIYPSADDMRNATLYSPDWSGGLAFPNYGVILIGIAPGDGEWAQEVIPHELTHLIVDQRMAGCNAASIPTWFEEGLAVYSEGPTSQRGLTLITVADSKGSLPALTSLSSGFADNFQRADLDYAISGSVVHYLMESYDIEKMDQLLTQLHSGQSFDKSLEKVYGLTTATLDRAWRENLGLSTANDPVASKAPTIIAGASPTVIPTFALQPLIGTATLAPTPSMPAETFTPVLAIPTQTGFVQPAYSPTEDPLASSTESAGKGLVFWVAGGIVLAAGGLFFVLKVKKQ